MPQGYMVGNPTTSRANVFDSEPHFALYKALISRTLFEQLVGACDNVFHNITPGDALPRAAGPVARPPLAAGGR